jgi:hypothetical protein
VLPRPRSVCVELIGYWQRGLTYGQTKLSRTVVVRPGTLRVCILVGRRDLFSLAPGHRARGAARGAARGTARGAARGTARAANTSQLSTLN